MTPVPDIIKAITDSVMDGAAALPKPLFTLPVRLSVLLAFVIGACALAFRMGSRSTAIQFSAAGFAVFLGAQVNVDALYQSINTRGNVACTLTLGVCAVILFLGPKPAARFLVAQQDQQAQVTRLILIGEASLIVLNLIWVVGRGWFT